jgi:hypothetical protein
MTAQMQTEKNVDPEKTALNKRMETIFWGLFLILMGGWAFIPNETVPKGAWSVAAGLLLFGFNAAHYFNRIRMSGFVAVLGVLAILGGIGDMLGWVDLDGAMLFIILGALLIVKPWFEERRPSGTAQKG